MDKLKELLSRCKCGVFVTVNHHRDYYESVEQYMGDREISRVDARKVAEMIRADTIIKIQFYPHTPIGSYIVWHYDLDAALDEALQCAPPTPVTFST
jgi:hypothetical protein